MPCTDNSAQCIATKFAKWTSHLIDACVTKLVNGGCAYDCLEILAKAVYEVIRFLSDLFNKLIKWLTDTIEFLGKIWNELMKILEDIANAITQPIRDCQNETGFEIDVCFFFLYLCQLLWCYFSFNWTKLQVWILFFGKNRLIVFCVFVSKYNIRNML